MALQSPVYVLTLCPLSLHWPTAMAHPSTCTHPVDDTPPLLPTVHVVTHHMGVTGVTWPIANDDDTSPALSCATHTAPCRLPPPLLHAATTTALCATTASLTCCHHNDATPCHPMMPTHHVCPTRVTLTHLTTCLPTLSIHPPAGYSIQLSISRGRAHT